MVKVDTRILGFNVTAAQNRINVGERDTWDPDSWAEENRYTH